jgi:hypothetical protein
LRVVLLLGVAALLVGIAAAVWIRVAPDDPARWHVDPLGVVASGQSNAWRVSPEGMGSPPDAVSAEWALPATELAAAFDRVALSAPRTLRLAGSPEELWTTYVQRSRLWGFPDYICVRAIDLGDGMSALAIYSRSRYGASDLGVNRARVEDWLARLLR